MRLGGVGGGTGVINVILRIACGLCLLSSLIEAIFRGLMLILGIVMVGLGGLEIVLLVFGRV